MGRIPNFVFEVSLISIPLCCDSISVTHSVPRFSGTKGSIKDSIARVKQISKANEGINFDSAYTEKEMANLWAARKEVLWANLATRPEGTQIWSTDVAVPLSCMAKIIG